ncbi:MAG: hypothetical protein ACTIAQ_04235 [Glutamicibacter arilaitensis]
MIENIAVQELGEDSDMWIVGGTSDAHSAEEAVRQWFENTTGETIEAFQDADDLVEFTINFRKDWAWLPGNNPEDPMDEAMLVYPHDGVSVGHLPAFAGFLVQA